MGRLGRDSGSLGEAIRTVRVQRRLSTVGPSIRSHPRELSRAAGAAAVGEDVTFTIPTECVPRTHVCD